MRPEVVSNSFPLVARRYGALHGAIRFDQMLLPLSVPPEKLRSFPKDGGGDAEPRPSAHRMMLRIPPLDRVLNPLEMRSHPLHRERLIAGLECLEDR